MRPPPGYSEGAPGKRPLVADTATKQVHSNGTTAIADLDSRQAEHARQVRGTLVVVVETPGGKYRRRTFLTLRSAERAVRNAEERGCPASIVIARLEPVAVVA